jgi:hypothetical protein
MECCFWNKSSGIATDGGWTWFFSKVTPYDPMILLGLESFN